MWRRVKRNCKYTKFITIAKDIELQAKIDNAGGERMEKKVEVDEIQSDFDKNAIEIFVQGWGTPSCNHNKGPVIAICVIGRLLKSEEGKNGGH